MTEGLPDELTGRSPEEVLTFLREACDDDLRAAVHRIGTPAVLDLLFTGMAGRFTGDEGRRPGRLAFALDDDGAEHVRVLMVDSAGARPAPSTGRSRATLRTGLLLFLRIAAGAADPKRLVLTGRLRLSGDLWWAVNTLRGLAGPGAR